MTEFVSRKLYFQLWRSLSSTLSTSDIRDIVVNGESHKVYFYYISYGFFILQSLLKIVNKAMLAIKRLISLYFSINFWNLEGCFENNSF